MLCALILILVLLCAYHDDDDDDDDDNRCLQELLPMSDIVKMVTAAPPLLCSDIEGSVARKLQWMREMVRTLGILNESMRMPIFIPSSFTSFTCLSSPTGPDLRPSPPVHSLAP
jgi:hypothetical protein